MTHLEMRLDGYRLLKGAGLEIGAFNAPAVLPEGCRVEYCDVISKEQAAKLFPELNPDDLVEVEHILDLDGEGLSGFAEGSFDFVVMNHVIEHVANPIRVIGEVFRVIKKDGLLVIAAPDKDYIFDRKRELTPFAHLLEEYRAGVAEVTDEHYIDFLRCAHPRDDEYTREEVLGVRARREHAHVWNSESFREFIRESLEILKLNAACLFERYGSETGEEHFSVWKKLQE